MSDAAVFEITQHEDWTTDVIWTDNFNTGQPIEHPCTFIVKAQDGSTLVTLNTDPDTPPGTVPGINVSTDIGLMQLHIDSETSGAFPPGQYVMELKATATDGGFAGPQRISLFTGTFLVHKSLTA